MVSEIKRAPLWKCLDLPLRYMYMCTLSYSVVCRQFEKMVQRSVADCVKFSVLVNKCVRPSCSLGTLHILKRQNKTKPGTHHIMYNFCSDPHMYLLWTDHLILRGIWKVFFRNKYSGQVMNKNQINILSCN
jgi:hypothetical protein